ncbi:MAG TPA: phosphomannomutase/phosphoglucomutase [Candidatus Pullichristensenella excrementigallinarum]|uniref:Phosphomannomutase/phosphoglucomutase n=1 Tax=Candidatus Pullichristensenella excrementigallinarum TaxID=2840907 RepID=A0A9D1LAW9_9FIRM|nr:phosphomannomutase/phosphoglucomutase [Candidatus Pullichristensenella excrementigallinarum]
MLSDPSGWLRLKSGSDIRGDQSQLTDEFAEHLGYAFALWLAEKTGKTTDQLKIAVGRDSRNSGPRLKSALIRGITAADCDVFDCGLCITPAMFMTTVDTRTQADGAVMLTASHQPAEKNGFKFITRAGGLSEEEMESVIRLAQQVEIPVRLVTPVDFLDWYVESLKAVVRERLEDDAPKPLLGLHVVVDAGNGAGGFYADFLEDLGAWVEGSQFLEPNGNFPNHAPNPEDAQVLFQLGETVKRVEADLGVIFDADCDRAAIVLGDGRPIHKNRLIALVAAMLLNRQPGLTFVTDSVTSTGLSRFISEWGGTHYRFRRGYKNVINEAIRLNEEGIDCPLAIETSGHAAFRENHFLDDGMYLVTRLICEAMDLKREGKTLYSLIEGLQEPVESLELRLDILPDDYREAAQEIIEAILSNTLNNPRWRLAPDNREGVRILFDLDGEVSSAFFQLRLSVHDPVMALNLESDVPGGVKFMLEELYALIQDTDALDLDPIRRALQ